MLQVLATPNIDDFAFMTGTWSFEQNGRRYTEVWMAPAGGTMMGMSRTVSNGKTSEFEFLVLRQETDGRITLTARPSGQEGGTFPLVKLEVKGSQRTAMFENLKHDFPQRIFYSLKKVGYLLAAIEGKNGDSPRRFEFPYQRVKD